MYIDVSRYGFFLLSAFTTVAGQAIEFTMVNDYFYVAKVHIGNPERLYDFALDVTTSDMLVYGNSTELQLMHDEETKPIYDPSCSHTSLYVGPVGTNGSWLGKLSNEPVFDQYQAYEYADVVKVNDKEVGSVRFTLVENYDYGSFAFLPTSGLFGFGRFVRERGIGIVPNLLHRDNYTTLTLYTPRSRKDKAVLSFGDQLPSPNCGAEKWTALGIYNNPNNDTQFFEMKFSRSTFGGQEVTPLFPYFSLSTMTSYITVSIRMFKIIQRYLNPTTDENSVKELNFVDCSFRDTAPDLTIGGDGFDFSIPARHYIHVTETGRCLLKVRANNAPKRRRWVLGAPFLRNFCVQFRLADGTIAFAPAQESANRDSEEGGAQMPRVLDKLALDFT